MDRLLALSLAAFLVFGVYLAWEGEPGLPSTDICEIFFHRPAWFAQAKAAEDRWGTPVPLQMAIIRHESGFRAKVRPPRRKILWIFPGPRPSSAYGYSQALDGTWRDYQRKRQRPSARRDRFSDAVDFVAWYGRQLSDLTGISLGDSYHLYLAYHQGPGGYSSGQYRDKPAVMKYARRVAGTVKRYEQRLTECGSRLVARQRLFLALEIALIVAVLWAFWRFRRRKSKRRA